MAKLKYKPDGAVARAFMKSDSFFRGIRGPVGSGKSVASSIEMFRRATQQEPGPNGVRKTRWAIIRNTNPQLRTTTIKTWLDWFPESEWGKFRWSVPYTHHIKKGDIDAEFIFLALDRPEDVKKLLSLELTGVWINEAREVSKSIVDACTMRVGRFPSMKDGGPSWYGVIADTNAPEEDHWWPIMAGEAPVPEYISKDEAMMLVKPDDWDFFTQPGGMVEVKDDQGQLTGYKKNPMAENAKHITPKYYPDIIKGKSRTWINVYVLNKLGVLQEGKPVYPSWNPETHLAKSGLMYSKDSTMFVGVDFGLTPAATFGQLIFGRWRVFKEVVTTDMGAARFAELLKHEMQVHFPEIPDEQFSFFGDPAGDHRAQTDETTPFQIFRAAGISIRPAPSNDPVLRVEAVEGTLNRLVDGEAGFLLDPQCGILRKGFDGGYAYKKLNVSGAERFDTRPDKNRYSHVHDALQYMCIGAGEGRKVVGATGSSKPHVAKRSFNPFEAMKGRKKRSQWNVFGR